MFKSCINCGNDKKPLMTVMTPIGVRQFCSDRCYAEYLGIDMDVVRGYYDSQVMEDDD